MIINNNNILDLSQLWSSITELSFISIFKILILIIFIILNVVLFYIEQLESIDNNKDNIQKSGIKTLPRKVGVALTGAMGLYSSYLTIKDDGKKQIEIDKLNQEIQELRTKSIIAEYTKEWENQVTKINITNIHERYKTILAISKEKKELEKALEAGDISSEDIPIVESKILELRTKDIRETDMLGLEIANSQKFINEIVSDDDDELIVKNDNLDMKLIEDENKLQKSDIFGLDKLWDKFENLDGLSKATLVFSFSSSLILWSIFTIIINMYGQYLLDRFNLESRFPKIAFFIKYRKNLSKYSIMSSYLAIIIMCLINIGFGLSILSITL